MTPAETALAILMNAKPHQRAHTLQDELKRREMSERIKEENHRLAMRARRDWIDVNEGNG